MAKRERPILFSGPMVRAILEGRKTQTRRVVKHDASKGWGDVRDTDGWPLQQTEQAVWSRVACPYGVPGDRLWVKETACYWTYADGTVGGQTPVVYADSPCWDGVCRDARAGRPVSLEEHIGWWKKRSSIHMPRRYSRLTLEVVAVRVERLQAISDNDAYAEGVEMVRGPQNPTYGVPGQAPTFKHYTNPAFNGGNGVGVAHSYRTLWESINGSGSWDANPWVWVVEFRRLTNGEA